MNFMADEGVDREIVQRLRKEGHEVAYIAEMDYGISDEMDLKQAKEKEALLVTADKDFGELILRQGQMRAGVLLLRLAGLSAEKKCALVAAVVREYADKLRRGFSVISPGVVRVRHEGTQ